MDESQINLRMILAKLSEISRKVDRQGNSDVPQYLSIKKAAAILDMEENAVRQMIHRREIPSYRLGRRRLIRAEDLERVMVKYPAIEEVLNG